LFTAQIYCTLYKVVQKVSHRVFVLNSSKTWIDF